MGYSVANRATCTPLASFVLLASLPFGLLAACGSEAPAAMTPAATAQHPLGTAPKPVLTLNGTDTFEIAFVNSATNRDRAIALALTDADNPATVRVELVANNGTVIRATNEGSALVQGQSNTYGTTLAVEGTIANVNATLATLEVRATVGYLGPSTVSIVASDLTTPSETPTSGAITIT